MKLKLKFKSFSSWILNKFQLILLVIIINSSFHVFAETQIVYFGGGESTDPNDKIFDESFLNVIKAAKIRNIKGSFYYPEKIVKKLTNIPLMEFQGISAKSFSDKIQSLISDIESGRIKPNDQLLLYLDTHGSLSTEGQYLIQTDKEWVDPLIIKNLIQAAEKKKVKLGIVAQTCYSGRLQQYASQNVCLISASQPEKAAYKIEGNVFSKLLADKIQTTNLEDLYLQTRGALSKETIPSQPIISTAVGTKTNFILKSIFPSISIRKDFEAETQNKICRNYLGSIERVKEKIQKLKEPLSQSLLKDNEINHLVNKIELKLKDYQALAEKSYSLDDSLQKSNELDRQLLGRKISEDERNLYNFIYKKLDKNYQGPNPCKDFKL